MHFIPQTNHDPALAEEYKYRILEFLVYLHSADGQIFIKYLLN